MTDPRPYALVAIGLLGGLAVLTSQPLGSSPLNWGLAAALLGAGFGAVVYMIVQNSGPGQRGPDFE